VARRVRVRVNERQVTYYIAPGGEVAAELDKIARNTKAIAQMNAPVRTGTLKKGIQMNTTKTTGPYTGHSMVTSSARHSMWVHDGTGTITAKNGPFLLVPKRNTGVHTTRLADAGTVLFKEWEAGGKKRGTRLFTRRQSVSGQRAQPFLKQALETAMGRWAL